MKSELVDCYMQLLNRQSSAENYPRGKIYFGRTDQFQYFKDFAGLPQPMETKDLKDFNETKSAVFAKLHKNFLPASLRNWGALSTDHKLEFLPDFDLVLFPVCHDLHFWLLVVDVRSGKLCSLNSMGTLGQTGYIDLLRELLDYHYAEVGRAPVNWITERVTVPQQNNNYDCGVFAMAYANSICYNGLSGGFTFSQRNMRDFRGQLKSQLVANMPAPLSVEVSSDTSDSL